MRHHSEGPTRVALQAELQAQKLHALFQRIGRERVDIGGAEEADVRWLGLSEQARGLDKWIAAG